MTAFALPWILTSRLDDEARPGVRAPAGDADTELVEALYARLEGRLTNVVYRWLWDREEVRDVLQETFVRLWQMRDRVDWDRAEPLVYRIALNLAAKRRRSRRIWRWVALDTAAEPTAGAPDDTAEREAIVRAAIDDLPERHRRVLVLTIHAGLGYDEIAGVLGISPGTVASRRHTAVAKLREAIARRERAS
jgi:RNA polymerase sigma-70 factor, ECF subfamily